MTDANALREQLDLATQFGIPCPEPAGAPTPRPEPLIVRKNTGWHRAPANGWSIINPNLDPGEQVWTGGQWEYRGQLAGAVIYQYTRNEALAEAQRLAVAETRRFENCIAKQRAADREEQQ